MPPTIDELRVEVTTNNLRKMQQIPLFDCIDIVLDQCFVSLTARSNI